MDVRVEPLLYTLREYNKLKEAQLRGENYTPGSLANGEWMTFGFYTKGSQYRKAGVFSRQDLVNDLLSLYSSGGTQAKVLSDNIQMALLAGVERALFHRNMTPARALAHAAARHSGVGTPDISIFDMIKDKINELEA